jgi:hypothetical protein
VRILCDQAIDLAFFGADAILRFNNPGTGSQHYESQSAGAYCESWESVAGFLRAEAFSMASDFPFMKFYVDDWLADEKARLCTSGARGLWIDMICLMWKSDIRGVLVQPNGFPVDARMLARLTGNGNKSTSKWLTELEVFGVCSIDVNGSYFCRRMVKDERVRQVRAAAGKKGGQTRILNERSDLLDDLLEQNGKQNPSKSVEYGIWPLTKQSSEIQGGGCKGETPLTGDDCGFEEFWNEYPKKTEREFALRYWRSLFPTRELLETILAALRSQKKTKEPRYFVKAEKWLDGKCWNDESTCTESARETPMEKARRDKAARDKILNGETQ